MSVFNKLSIVLYSVHWYMYMFILKVKSPCCSGGKTASMLGCQIGGFVAS